jgi:predicted nuclease of predicted toxin-antitoxin system
VTIWLDNHLSPALARWIEASFAVPCCPVRDMGLARASDRDIFDAARGVARVLITKDRDFAELSVRLGPPPGIILLTMGNTSTAHLIGVLETALPTALGLLAAGEALVEIGGG